MYYDVVLTFAQSDCILTPESQCSLFYLAHTQHVYALCDDVVITS